MHGTNYLWTRAMHKYRIHSEDNHDYKPREDTLADLEKESINNYRARALLASAYNQGWSQIFRSYLNIPKSLYYSKLDGCDTNNGYSYASYLHTLFHNYPDDKEYLKVAYAMLLFTKFNAYSFYKYSNFDALEQNITPRMDRKDIEYVISNYQDIIAKECEGILSDHDQVPTEEKLMKYAFPLKSDNNGTIGK
ncbi:MAG: hypothetical protein LBC09_01935 [Helicobacteraceae bacterium]|nr:hypothetical protein [Helicobacteraceae bacterium]